MEENRFKLRISRMFRSSFGSCRSKKITDVIEKPIFLPENREQEQHHQSLIDLFTPKPRPFPSVCRPKYPQSETQKSLLLTTENTTTEGQKCPPASPAISPLMNTFYQLQHHATTSSSSKNREKKNKKSAINKRVPRVRSKSFGLHEFPALSYNGLFSSDEDDDDDDDKMTLFSSRSLSSDSSDQSFIRNKAYKSNNKPAKKTTNASRQRKAAASNESAGPNPIVPELKGKVKDSFAVVKRSRDPYNDFRTSMLEMIVERQIFCGKDLENLLHCFLSLNSYHHHRVIIQVFTEIWEALFSNWSSL